MRKLVARVSQTSSVNGVRYRSSGRVRNAMRIFRKSESLRQMKNIEGRINHSQLIEEQRATKLETKAERARLHSELVETHKARKEGRAVSEGAAPSEKARNDLKIQKRNERTARRAAARVEIREANQKLAEMLANRKTESL